jgi:hypothetical protein
MRSALETGGAAVDAGEIHGGEADLQHSDVGCEGLALALPDGALELTQAVSAP